MYKWTTDFHSSKDHSLNRSLTLLMGLRPRDGSYQELTNRATVQNPAFLLTAIFWNRPSSEPSCKTWTDIISGKTCTEIVSSWNYGNLAETGNHLTLLTTRRDQPGRSWEPYSNRLQLNQHQITYVPGILYQKARCPKSWYDCICKVPLQTIELLTASVKGSCFSYLQATSTLSFHHHDVLESDTLRREKEREDLLSNSIAFSSVSL